MQPQTITLTLLLLAPFSVALSCRSCHSWNNTACVREPWTLLSKDCPPEDTECATVIISATGHLFRGCSTDAECVQEGEACVKCDAFRNCNTLLYPASSERLNCNICQTSANVNCATLPYYKQFEKGCIRHVAGDECVTIFDGFQVVRRECWSGLTATDLGMCGQGSNQCVACRGVACNKVTVRGDDSCLQCTSDAGNCGNGRRGSARCGKVSTGVCYNRLGEDRKLYRGCLSDLSAELQAACLSGNDKSCETCQGTGCNRNLFPADALQCVQCTSEDLDCVQRQVDDALVKPCPLYVSGDKCYTRLHSDGTLDRGCHSGLSIPCDPLFNVTCTMCEGEACNREVYPAGRRSCYQCDGLDDLNCAVDQASRSNGSMVCRNFAEQDGCYTLLENGRVIRGCASDFSVDVCKGLERTQCQVCDEDDCNGISELRLRSCVDKVIFDTVLLVIVIVYATFML